MSSLHLTIGAVLLLVFGYWFVWRRHSRLLDELRPGAKDAIWELAILAVFLPSVSLANIRTDGWSVIDWLEGLCFVAVVFVAGVNVGQVYQMRRQRRPGAGEAQRVGTGFSPR